MDMKKGARAQVAQTLITFVLGHHRGGLLPVTEKTHERNFQSANVKMNIYTFRTPHQYKGNEL